MCVSNSFCFLLDRINRILQDVFCLHFKFPDEIEKGLMGDVVMGDRGRTASYPAAPSQTPPCGITATGSSGLFAWVLTLSAILRSEVCINSPARLCPVNVSFADYIILLTPSPCDRPYRL